MRVVNTFALFISLNLQDLSCVFLEDHLLQELKEYNKEENNSALTPICASTLICFQIFSHFIPYSLSFDQDLAIIIPWAQNKFNKSFRAKLLFITIGLRS